jgi:hypothetical protein
MGTANGSPDRRARVESVLKVDFLPLIGIS